jgi:hypothetical protein
MAPSNKPARSAQDAPARTTHSKAHHREELSVSLNGLQKNTERTLEVVERMTQVEQLLLRRKQKAQQEAPETEQTELGFKEVAARQMDMAIRREQVADRKEEMVARREEAERKDK